MNAREWYLYGEDYRYSACFEGHEVIWVDVYTCRGSEKLSSPPDLRCISQKNGKAGWQKVGNLVVVNVGEEQPLKHVPCLSYSIQSRARFMFLLKLFFAGPRPHQNYWINGREEWNRRGKGPHKPKTYVTFWDGNPDFPKSWIMDAICVMLTTSYSIRSLTPPRTPQHRNQVPITCVVDLMQSFTPSKQQALCLRGLPGIEYEGTTHGNNYSLPANVSFTFNVGVEVFGNINSLEGFPAFICQLDDLPGCNN
ncbi:hypothetical protein C8J55DRAFT_493518 [Lentinula edodes]|uniref:Uncharacterized protein n=1 Tax=Lentinula lateritia TaxID=40482 RepID=A0A9W8ZTC9_9AGAR|nr:hypothetical protein C8J55DRAFT_493518 [Lentinula edodes]